MGGALLELFGMKQQVQDSDSPNHTIGVLQLALMLLRPDLSKRVPHAETYYNLTPKPKPQTLNPSTWI